MHTKAQIQWDTRLLIEDDLEEIVSENEEAFMDDEIEALAQRLQSPINLNSATREQLEALPFLSDQQIENILYYVYRHGSMQTIYELQLVEQMDRKTIEKMLPFVCVQPLERKAYYPSLSDLLKGGKHELLTRLDIPFYRRKGYEKDYLGTPQYHSLRYQYRFGDYLQWGINGEKDAGEPLFALHDKRGYDHYGIYVLVRELGPLKTLALGNYKLNFGMGLVLSSRFMTGKSYSFQTVESRGNRITQHGSFNEYNYFSGVAATIQPIKGVELSAFYSNRNLDGSVNAGGELTSIDKTGLHRTQKEVDKRNAVKMQLAGGNITWRQNLFDVGVTGITYGFNKEYKPRLSGYAKYNMHGKRFYNLGLDYQLRLGRFHWAGEAAKGTKGFAFINRLAYRFSGNYKLLLVQRYYTHDYWSFFGRSFGEAGGVPQNESGWYAAAEMSPVAHWNFFASVDLFSFPWWRYRVSKPSQGVDVMFKAQYTPSNQWNMYVNFRYKRKERDVTGTGGEVILPTHQYKWRARLNGFLGKFQLRTTADYTLFRHAQSGRGYAITQTVISTPFRFPLTATLQGTYFHTDDYDSRVYTSERNLLYSFYSPSFSGEGWRCSLHARCDLGQHFTLLLKLGHTFFTDRENIGSGSDAIASPRKTDLQLQARLKF